jgi:serine/threonine protein kinase
MYNFAAKKTAICDIDFYSKMPYTNNMGRLWGSSRFMSPEEFELGAAIDEITNVYLMGVTAFALFSDYHRSFEKWQLSEELYKVALRAVSNQRNQRQQSIHQFIEEWNEVKV